MKLLDVRIERQIPMVPGQEDDLEGWIRLELLDSEDIRLDGEVRLELSEGHLATLEATLVALAESMLKDVARRIDG